MATGIEFDLTTFRWGCRADPEGHQAYERGEGLSMKAYGEKKLAETWR